MKEKNEIKIDGVEYVRKERVKQVVAPARQKKGLTFCIVRTYSAVLAMALAMALAIALALALAMALAK